MIIFPAILLALLVLFPPHELDLWVSHLFWQNGAWVGQASKVAEFVGHEGIKLIPTGIALCYGYYAWRFWRQGDRLSTQRSLFVLVGLLLALLAVWWLKRTTGVFCPWSTTPFGGEREILNSTWNWVKVPGNCWPAGHSGTGFGLFMLYFAWRDAHARKANLWLGVALAMGIFCSFLRITQGAHFLSHTVASLLIDWTLGAVLYYVWLYRWRKRPQKVVP